MSTAAPEPGPRGDVDPRTQRPGICGVTRTIGRTEWICIRPVHAKLYTRHRNGQTIYDNNPEADRHHMVPRYPWRQP